MRVLKTLADFETLTPFSFSCCEIDEGITREVILKWFMEMQDWFGLQTVIFQCVKLSRPFLLAFGDYLHQETCKVTKIITRYNENDLYEMITGTNIEYLDIYTYRQPFIPMLSTLTKLKHLQITVHSSELKELCDVIRENTTLIDLTVDITPWGCQQNVKLLTDAIRRHVSIQRVFTWGVADTSYLDETLRVLTHPRVRVLCAIVSPKTHKRLKKPICFVDRLPKELIRVLDHMLFS